MKEMDEYENKVLVVSVPYCLKKDAIRKLREDLIKQKKEGVIVLPAGLKFEFIPKCTELKVIAPNIDFKASDNEGGEAL